MTSGPVTVEKLKGRNNPDGRETCLENTQVWEVEHKNESESKVHIGEKEGEHRDSWAPEDDSRGEMKVGYQVLVPGTLPSIALNSEAGPESEALWTWWKWRLVAGLERKDHTAFLFLPPFALLPCTVIQYLYGIQLYFHNWVSRVEFASISEGFQPSL